MSPESSDYYQRERHDVAALIPTESRKILEIGAGFGTLGRILSARGDVVLDAVEINPEAVSHLTGVYRKIWIGDLERLTLEGAARDYDCLVCADVLEHLVEPWSQLARLCGYLRDGGCVVASLPNIRNVAVLYRLLVLGRWEYEDSGLLDRTHLRFFTRRSVAELIDGAGLTIERWATNRDRYTGLRKSVVSIVKLAVPDIDVCQYLVLARKR